MRTSLLLAALVLPLGAPRAATGQAADDRGTLVVALAREAQLPVPTLWRNDQSTRELSDLLFLHLADLGPALSTSSERSFVPRLARAWSRRDPRTLVFELDPRARWQDGTPVTSRDVIFAMDRARNAELSPQVSVLLRRLSGVTAEGDQRVVFHYSEPYAEQLYDAVYHAPPLPAHLLAGIPPESLATSRFVAQPVGNGPYRLVRRVPGQLTELAADDSFFLGTPRIRRVVFLVAGDGDARANLLLSGEVDAVDNIYALPNPSRLERLPQLLYYPLPGLGVNYATFNPHDRSDSTRPHPVLAELAVRRALVESVDRNALARLNYGALSSAPSGPFSAIVSRNLSAPRALPYDTADAGRLLRQAGWVDHDGDGTRDRRGVRLVLHVVVPAPSAARIAMATQMQEGWRRLGIEAILEVVEPGIFTARRKVGDFDLIMDGVTQDPTPSGLTQSWTCAGIGGSNFARYCNRRVDSLLAAAPTARGGPESAWRQAARLIAADLPALFLVAPVSFPAVHRRFTNVSLRPESTWSTVWQWSVRPGQQIDRDRP